MQSLPALQPPEREDPLTSQPLADCVREKAKRKPSAAAESTSTASCLKTSSCLPHYLKLNLPLALAYRERRGSLRRELYGFCERKYNSEGSSTKVGEATIYC